MTQKINTAKYPVIDVTRSHITFIMYRGFSYVMTPVTVGAILIWLQQNRKKYTHEEWMKSIKWYDKGLKKWKAAYPTEAKKLKVNEKNIRWVNRYLRVGNKGV